MDREREQQVRQAMSAATDHTRDGRPAIGAVNETLRSNNMEPITAAERDALWQAMQDGGGGQDMADNDTDTAGPGTDASKNAGAGAEGFGPRTDADQKEDDGGTARQATIDDDAPPSTNDVNPAIDATVHPTAADFDQTTGEDADKLDGMDSDEEVTIFLQDAPANPVPVTVNGRNNYTLAVGKEHKVPVEVVEVLRHAGAKLELRNKR